MCTVVDGFVVSGNSMCSVQYTTDSMYRNLSEKISVPLSSEISTVEAPTLNITYFFVFSLFVDDTFLITDRLFFKAIQAVPGKSKSFHYFNS